MLKRLRMFFCVLTFSLIGINANQALGAEVAPDVLVKNTANEVLEIIRKDKDMQAGDQKKIFKLAEEKILPNFDFERVCKMVLGKYWTRATPQQKEDFEREFRTLILRTYAVALSKYRDQVIEYKPLRAQPEDVDVTVKTSILQPSGPPVLVDYNLEKTADGWKVYDIVIEGVSLVTNYRSNFSTEVRQSGLDNLISKLIEKNKQAAPGKS